MTLCLIVLEPLTSQLESNTLVVRIERIENLTVKLIIFQLSPVGSIDGGGSTSIPSSFMLLQLTFIWFTQLPTSLVVVRPAMLLHFKIKNIQ